MKRKTRRAVGPRPIARRRSAATSRADERVKELTCLYEIAQRLHSSSIPLPRILQSVVDALPSAWQSPRRARARLALDAWEARTPGAPAADTVQSAPIRVRGCTRGEIQVGYAPAPAGRRAPALLREEQRLLNEVARQVGICVERIEARAEQDALERKLRQAGRLASIGQFSSGLAHEINEPLGAILGFAQLVAKTPGVPSRARADLERIQAAALHAREIIRKLMTFARRMPPRRSPVDLNALIRNSASLWMLRCEDNGVRVMFDLAGDLPPLPADEAQIRQVVTNLAVNAAQAMPDGGTMRVRTMHRGGGAEIAVCDTGEGIPDNVMPRIFDPFFTTKDVNEGTGLGLSVVHGIVAAHGGRVEVSSQVGRGTEVQVWLPYLPEPVAEPPAGEGG